MQIVICQPFRGLAPCRPLVIPPRLREVGLLEGCSRMGAVVRSVVGEKISVRPARLLGSCTNTLAGGCCTKET